MKKKVLLILVFMCIMTTQAYASKFNGKGYLRIHWGGVGISYSQPDRFWTAPPTDYSIELGTNDDGVRFISVTATDAAGNNIACTQTERPSFDGRSLFINAWNFLESWGPNKSIFVYESQGFCTAYNLYNSAKKL
ncbi:MAG: hypothetical protein ACC657_18120 [Thiohalomonadales bacterium]